MGQQQLCQMWTITNNKFLTIQTMRQRELKYRVGNYMPRFHETNPSRCRCGTTNTNRNVNEDTIDFDCRTKMCQWSYQIIDHCNFSRETVAVSMNLLDRFVDACSLSPAIQMTRSTYQLAAITTLYTAIKLCEPQAISSTSMAALSSGLYSTEQIESMEVHAVLPTLNWLVNPPTAATFGQYYVDLLVLFLNQMNQQQRDVDAMDADNDDEINV